MASTYPADPTFNPDDRNTWTRALVKREIDDGGNTKSRFIRTFFNLTGASAYREASQYIEQLLARNGVRFDSGSGMDWPAWNGPNYADRVRWENIAMYVHPEWFFPEYLRTEPRPHWYVDGMLRGDNAAPSTAKTDQMRTMLQKFFAFVRFRAQRKAKDVGRSQRKRSDTPSPPKRQTNKRTIPPISMGSSSVTSKRARLESHQRHEETESTTTAAAPPSCAIQDAKVFFAVLHPDDTTVSTKKWALGSVFLQEPRYQDAKPNAFDEICKWYPPHPWSLTNMKLFFFNEGRIMQIEHAHDLSTALLSLHKEMSALRADNDKLLLFWATDEEVLEALPVCCRTFTDVYKSKEFDYASFLEDQCSDHNEDDDGSNFSDGSEDRHNPTREATHKGRNLHRRR